MYAVPFGDFMGGIGGWVFPAVKLPLTIIEGITDVGGAVLNYGIDAGLGLFWEGGILSGPEVLATRDYIRSHTQDFFRIAGGLFDTVVGIGLGWTGAGVGLIGLGIDQIVTGLLNLATNSQGMSPVELVVSYATGSETTGNLAPAVLSLGLWGAGSWFGISAVALEAPGFGGFFRLTRASNVNLDAAILNAGDLNFTATLWTTLANGQRLRRIGNYWLKEVNLEASSFMRWWGRGELNAQVRALSRLGDMTPSYLFTNGKLIIRHAGEYTPGTAWSSYLRGSWRMKNPFNDIGPRNMGVNGIIFDPALHPIQQVVYMGSLISVPSAIAYFGYHWNDIFGN